MAIKKINTICLLLVIILCLALQYSFMFFGVVSSLLVLYVSFRSLYVLWLYNFASDEKIYKYEKRIALKVPLSADELYLVRFKNVLLNMVFITLFVEMFFLSQNIIFKFLALFTAVLWTFDLVKTLISYVKAPKEGKWSAADTFFEILMWVQNIVSLGLVLFGFISVL